MRILLSYLDEKQKIKWQLLSKWWYDIGVGRVQTRLPTKNPIFAIKSSFSAKVAGQDLEVRELRWEITPGMRAISMNKMLILSGGKEYPDQLTIIRLHKDEYYSEKSGQIMPNERVHHAVA